MAVIQIAAHALPSVYKVHLSTQIKVLEQFMQVVSSVVNNSDPMPPFLRGAVLLLSPQKGRGF